MWGLANWGGARRWGQIRSGHGEAMAEQWGRGRREKKKKKKNDIENTNVYMQERERRIAILVGVTGRRIIQD